MILDELHALVTSKRGDLLALGLARLRTLAPRLKTIGLSATVADPDALRGWLVGQESAGRTAYARPPWGEVATPAFQPGVRVSPPKPFGRGANCSGAAPSPSAPGLRSRRQGAEPSPPWRSAPPVRTALAPYRTRERGRRGRAPPLADLVIVDGGAKPEITILDSEERMPWSGHSSKYAVPDIYDIVKRHRMALLFVNVRSQAELIFQELWRINADGLPIALHHGSLDAGAAAEGRDGDGGGKTPRRGLHLDARPRHRLGRRRPRRPYRRAEGRVAAGAADRARQPPARRAVEGDPRPGQPLRGDRMPRRARRATTSARRTRRRSARRARRARPAHPRHGVLGAVRCRRALPRGRSAYPYRDLDRATFDRVVDFVATGGYALRTYERYAKIRQGPDGLWRITHPRVAQQYRLNVGTIIEAPLLNVRVARTRGRASPGAPDGPSARSRKASSRRSSPGDTFLFAGLILRYEGMRENEVIATRTADDTPKIPIYDGGKFPITSYLADGVRTMLADPKSWKRLPAQVSDWLKIQKKRSLLPKRDQLLVETFPRGNRTYMVAYPFEGRLAHQTLGMLLTRRLERARLRPTGFVATDYSIAIWALGDLGRAFAGDEPSLAELFDEDMLGDDLEAWMAESYLLKRMFRNTALISGLIEKRHPGREKSGRQVTVSTDLIYDVLRRHEPDHILLQATWADAATGLARRRAGRRDALAREGSNRA